MSLNVFHILFQIYQGFTWKGEEPLRACPWELSSSHLLSQLCHHSWSEQFDCLSSSTMDMVIAMMKLPRTCKGWQWSLATWAQTSKQDYRVQPFQAQAEVLAHYWMIVINYNVFFYGLNDWHNGMVLTSHDWDLRLYPNETPQSSFWRARVISITRSTWFKCWCKLWQLSNKIYANQIQLVSNKYLALLLLQLFVFVFVFVYVFVCENETLLVISMMASFRIASFSLSKSFK